MTPILCSLLISALSLIPADGPARAFPLHVVADEGGDGLMLDFDAAAAAALVDLHAVRLSDVPLPGGNADLLLERVLVAGTDAPLVVDGQAVTGVALDDGLTLWGGTIAGQPQSHVFLGFSRFGSRGWFQTGSDTVHLLAGAGASGWGAASSRLVSESRLEALGVERGPICATPTLPRVPGAQPVVAPSGEYSGSGSNGILYECRIAVETDTQFYDLFGDVDAARTYAVTLWGAVADVYRSDVGAIITLPYLAIYSGADPWVSQDIGGNSIDTLFEFQDAWDGGAAPVAADLFHLVSGASLGGGVAYLSVLCHPDYAFAVSGNLAGDTPFPVVQGPLNWDFVVTAHETGHNFGTPHTHDYCPPLDECAPDGYFGACQTQQVCGEGTIMGYCHLCDGGLANVIPSFHPVAVQTMRDFMEDQSCLQGFTGVFPEDLGFALAGGGGAPALAVGYSEPDVLFEYANVPAPTSGFLVVGLSPLFAPLKGGILVPDPTIVVTFAAPLPALTLDVSIANGVAPQGIVLWAQTWFPDAGGPKGFSATNAVELEIIKAAPWPAPSWIAHPTNGKEYALSSPGSWSAALAEAQGHGGSLATVPDASLNAWLVAAFAGSTASGTAFLGFNDSASEGTFVWASGAATTFTNWAGGQPDNAEASGEDVAELDLGTGEWNDFVGAGWLTNHAIMERDQ